MWIEKVKVHICEVNTFQAFIMQYRIYIFNCFTNIDKIFSTLTDF